MEKLREDYEEAVKLMEKKISKQKKEISDIEELFASRPSKDEDLKLIYELQEEIMRMEKQLIKAEEDKEYYKNHLINSEEKKLQQSLRNKSKSRQS